MRASASAAPTPRGATFSRGPLVAGQSRMCMVRRRGGRRLAAGAAAGGNRGGPARGRPPSEPIAAHAARPRRRPPLRPWGKRGPPFRSRIHRMSATAPSRASACCSGERRDRGVQVGELVDAARRRRRLAVAMTENAQRFVSATTFQALTRTGAHDAWDAGAEGGDGPHRAGARADRVLVARNRHTLARLGHGMADDLSARCAWRRWRALPVAPAMNHRMCLHRPPATTWPCCSRAAYCAGAADGRWPKASRARPHARAAALVPRWHRRERRGFPRDAGRGGCRAHLRGHRPVRFLGNRSSGRMVFAVAGRGSAAWRRHLLVAGPVALARPSAAPRRLRSAAEMHPRCGGAAAACSSRRRGGRLRPAVVATARSRRRRRGRAGAAPGAHPRHRADVAGMRGGRGWWSPSPPRPRIWTPCPRQAADKRAPGRRQPRRPGRQRVESEDPD